MQTRDLENIWPVILAKLNRLSHSRFPTLSQADLDELAGDVALYLVRHLDSIRSENPVAFALAVFRSLAIGLLRRRRIRREFQIPLDFLWPLETIEGDPAFLAIQDESRRKVRAAISELPLPARETIELYYLSGLRLSRIAARLGVSISTVQRRVEDGRELLRSKLVADNFPM